MASARRVPLAWARGDIEQRLMFSGARHTAVNSVLTALLGASMTVLFYGMLLVIRDTGFAAMFLKPWPAFAIPVSIVFFSFWSLAILLIKYRKLAFQRRALDYVVVPDDPTFVLSGGNVDVVMERIYEIVDDPKHFVLYNRIAIALANLRNLGRVGDVDEILSSQAENDESAMETSYSLISGFIWAIPVLGFIGTVLGLASAIGGFTKVLASTNEMEEVKDALMGVTGGLGTAFETTLQALVAALVIQLILTFLKKAEQEFLDECSRYCTNHIVNRLRLMPFERVDAATS